MGVILLGKIKLYDIAKELNLTSKEVLEIAKKLNIDAKSHLSAVDESDAQKIKESVKSIPLFKNFAYIYLSSNSIIQNKNKSY